jgi:ribosomal protein S18 acetylase RimI-like enzyme
MSSKINFRPMEIYEQPLVRGMIKDLYAALLAPQGWMTDDKISATFNRLHKHPEHLKIDVFEMDQQLVGYAILFDFWYNEYGGMVLNIDELYVTPQFRSQGLASMYIEKLSTRTHYKALSLEVLPRNKEAFSLYKRLGFEAKETKTLHKILYSVSDFQH